MSSISAGRPSYADDAIDQRLDLNHHLVRHPGATFFVRVSGESMTGAHIYPDDLLVVDRIAEPIDQSIVIASIDGDLTVKMLRIVNGKPELHSSNPELLPMPPLDEQHCVIWGVVSYVIHKV